MSGSFIGICDLCVLLFYVHICRGSYLSKTSFNKSYEDVADCTKKEKNVST